MINPLINSYPQEVDHMTRRALTRRIWPFAKPLATSAMLATLCSLPVLAIEPTPQEADRNANNEGKQSTNVPDENAEDEAPALGVIVSPCPGDAVCVQGTVWGSPAAEAGIEAGDYLISIDGKPVTSPHKLCETVKNMPQGKEVTIKVWREGRESEKSVTLASKADQPPESHRAWLGVSLSSASNASDPSRDNSNPEDSAGVVIEQVFPGSPADEGGLRSGDQVIKIAKQEVKNVADFVAAVEDRGPDSELQLTLLRGDDERETNVRLGHMDDAPMRFLRQALRPRWSDTGNEGRRNEADGGENEAWMSMLEDSVDELNRELRDLRQEVEELRGNEELRDNSDAEESKSSSLLEPGKIRFVAQRGNRGNNRNDYRGNRDYRSNRGDWNRGNWNRGDWNRYNSGRYGTSQLYRSPYYGNSYYNYGGRPYYYGGYGRNYGYGLRSGIQLGPGLGIYWY